MNCYEIRYSRNDMPDDYVGRTEKWARDEKQAISYICKSKPKEGRCTAKKGGLLTILSVKRIQ